MEISSREIDGGKAFDWGRTSEDYAKYRDIYPEIFYRKIIERGLCTAGQRILDLGTGTGVLPRHMYRFGGNWTGADISENQIRQARRLSREKGQDITYLAVPAEEVEFPDETFDVVTACQCYWYFDYKRLLPRLVRMLKREGSLLLLYMAWLPQEDPIAEQSEKLVLKYSPGWTGAGETVHPIQVPDCVYRYFRPVHHEEYQFSLPFTRESWNGRMKACRGVGASLTREEVDAWEREHLELLERTAPEQFSILHYAALLELKKTGEVP